MGSHHLMRKSQILALADEYWKAEHVEKVFNPGESLIPASGQTISSQDISAVVDAALDGWFTEHKRCAQFTRSLSRVIGKSHITLVNSGSSANLIATLACLENRPEKLVVTCAAGFPTSVSPIYQAGKIPLYIDIDPETLCPKIDEAICALDKYGKEIAGIILAHNLGLPFKEYIIGEYYGRKRKPIIIDCCDALGARIHENHVGYAGDISTFSFFPAHIITSGEGGAIATNSIALHRVIRSLVNWGRDCHCLPGQSNTCGKRFEYEWPRLPKGFDHKYTFTRLGYNLKMTELQAALGNSQLSRLSDFVTTRRINFNDLYYVLGEFMDHIFLYDVIDPHFYPTPFGFPIRVQPNKTFTASELIAYLEEHKIATRRFFGGNLTRQPAFANLPFIALNNLPGADDVLENLFWIGCGPQITSEMITYIRHIFIEFFKGKGLL